MFRFAQPEYLYLLIIVPILWGLFIYDVIGPDVIWPSYGNPSVAGSL